MQKTNPARTLLLLIGFMILASGIHAENLISPDDPNIQYFGRWDFSDPLAPTHSWPGVSVYAEFEGTSIGVKLNDNFCYWNVIIDGALTNVFIGTTNGAASYTLASGLTDGHHTLLLHKRNETTWLKKTFLGLILDDGKSLLTPPEKPTQKIEFIGDSFTSAEWNELTDETASSDAPYTNVYEGFGPIVGRHYGAQYHMTSISGWGLVLDWQSVYSNNIPDQFDKTHTCVTTPLWDFEEWVPDIAVIGLGLNDYSGFGGWEGTISGENKNLFKTRYHDFIATIRDVYPGVNILAVAANGVEWLMDTIAEVVAEENATGHEDVFYTDYPYYTGGYAHDHPTVATHYLIADRLIAAIDANNLWEKRQDTLPPAFTKLPTSPQTVYETPVVLNVETDSYATVRYSDEDKPYDQMENTFTTTGMREHSISIPCEHGQAYTFYLRAVDVNGNTMDTSAVVSFDVDTTKIVQDWKSLGFDDSTWKKGLAPLGYGEVGGFGTEISSVNAAYFRKQFTVADVTTIKRISLLAKGSDGIVIYLNGHELSRTNFLTDEEISYETNALGAMTISRSLSINSNNGLDYLKTGENLIAVEVHVSASGSTGLSFDAKAYQVSSVTYFDLGSEWTYYDEGNTPTPQLKDKTSGVISDTEVSLPTRPELCPNFPNPFNPTTQITYVLPREMEISLTIYDLLGREVVRLAEGKQTAGQHTVRFDGSGLSSGVYVAVLRTEGFMEKRKMLLMK